ncbi:S8/S53 family peptidase [Nisaea sp.]|uniref:S8/S53 family peptidase n=2 Tax=Alphaproteobacteria TaxID=28211 RepID=UPI0032672265
MGVWSVGIVDTGVTDETEGVYGASLFEYDYYDGDSDTDGGRTTSHGSLVATSVELTNEALERLDLKVSGNSETEISPSAVNSALTQIGVLHDAGWHIGAYNMSFGSTSYSWTSTFQAQIDALAERGIFGVAASGNDGTGVGFENASYPARLSNVISVGSHDGSGNPSWFSQNNSSTVHLLADGEDFPGTGDDGTSFAAPQVSATVTTIQALVEGVTSDRLSFDETIDVLQLGGAGPQSSADPVDGVTTYFLHTHSGSVDYALSTYVDPVFSGLEYIASYSDIESAFVRDAGAARSHYISTGVYEGRTVAFDGLEYVASYSDLIGVFGTNREAAATHYLDFGRNEGRTVTFDADNYMNANPDVAAAFGADDDLATQHYISHGIYEGRSTGISVGSTSALVTVAQAVSEGSSDLPKNSGTSGYVGIGQSATGTITLYDHDWFRTELTAGETIVIQARGSVSDGGTLNDPVLRLYDANNNYLGYDDDGGVGRDAYLTYTPTTSGDFYIEVDGFYNYTGSYTIEVDSASNASLSTLEQETASLDVYKDPVVDDVQAANLAGSGTYADWVF